MARTAKTKPDLKQVAAEKTVKPTEVKIETMKLCLLGTSGFLFHRKSQKAWQTLLMGGGGTRTRADRAGILKHRPWDEFRESVYRSRDPKNATLLQFPASAFRQSAQTAALDMPGFAKTEVGRWIVVEGGGRDELDDISSERQMYVNMYGVPQITLDMVRNLGASRAPDVRCKAILAQWCCEIWVRYATPNLNRMGVLTLVNNGGILSGVGDGRQEKGKLSYGMFQVVDAKDPRFLKLKKEGGRQAQVEAMANPASLDDQTDELLGWYDAELARRQSSGEAPEIEEDDLEEVC